MNCFTSGRVKCVVQFNKFWAIVSGTDSNHVCIGRIFSFLNEERVFDRIKAGRQRVGLINNGSAASSSVLGSVAASTSMILNLSGLSMMSSTVAACPTPSFKL